MNSLIKKSNEVKQLVKRRVDSRHKTIRQAAIMFYYNYAMANNWKPCIVYIDGCWYALVGKEWVYESEGYIKDVLRSYLEKTSNPKFKNLGRWLTNEIIEKLKTDTFCKIPERR